MESDNEYHCTKAKNGNVMFFENGIHVSSDFYIKKYHGGNRSAFNVDTECLTAEERRRHLKDLKNNLKRKANDCSDCEKRLQTCESDLGECTESIRRLEEQSRAFVETCNAEKLALTTQHHDLDELYQSLKENEKSLLAQKDQLLATMQEAVDSNKKLTSDITTLQSTFNSESSELRSQLENGARQLSDLRSNLAQKTKELEQSQFGNKGLNSQIQRLTEERDTLAKTIQKRALEQKLLSEKLKETEKTLGDDRVRFGTEKAAFNNQIEKLQEEGKTDKTEIERLTTQLSETQDSLGEANEKLEQTQQERLNLQQSLDKVDQQLLKLQSEYDKADEDRNECRKNLQEGDGDRRTLRENLRVANEETSRIREERDLLKSEQEKLNTQKSVVDSELDNVKQQIADLKTRNLELTNNLQQSSEKSAVAESSVRDLQTKLDSLNGQFTLAENKRMELVKMLESRDVDNKQALFKIKEYEGKITTLTTKVEELQGMLAAMTSKNYEVTIKELRDKMDSKQRDFERQRADLTRQIKTLNEKHSSDFAAWNSATAEFGKDIEKYKNSVGECNESKQKMENEMTGLRSQLEQSRAACEQSLQESKSELTAAFEKDKADIISRKTTEFTESKKALEEEKDRLNVLFEQLKDRFAAQGSAVKKMEAENKEVAENLKLVTNNAQKAAEDYLNQKNREQDACSDRINAAQQALIKDKGSPSNIINMLRAKIMQPDTVPAVELRTNLMNRLQEFDDMLKRSREHAAKPVAGYTASNIAALQKKPIGEVMMRR